MATKKTTAQVHEPSLKELVEAKLSHNFSLQPADANNEHFYNALALVLRDKLRRARVQHIHEAHKQDAKQV